MAEAVAEKGVDDKASIQSIINNNVDLQSYPNLTYTSLFARYANSEFGQFHAEQPARYSNKPEYAYDRNLMIADLGDDVHPLRHMPHTEGAIFKPLMAYQNQRAESVQPFRTFEVMAGRVGALLHDVGECQHPDLGETVGDVNYHLKTNEDEKIETRIRGLIYAKLFSDVPVWLTASAEGMIVNPTESFLGRGFQTAEWLGYFLTGIRAGYRAFDLAPKVADGQDERRVSALGALATKVSQHWFDRLPERAEEFPYAAMVREKNASMVERIAKELAA